MDVEDKLRGLYEFMGRMRRRRSVLGRLGVILDDLFDGDGDESFLEELGRGVRKLGAPGWLIDDLGPRRAALLAYASSGGAVVERAGGYVVAYRPGVCVDAFKEVFDEDEVLWDLLDVGYYYLDDIAEDASSPGLPISVADFLSSLEAELGLDDIVSVSETVETRIGRDEVPLVVAGVDPDTGRAFMVIPPSAVCLAVAAWRRPVEEWLVREILGFDVHYWEDMGRPVVDGYYCGVPSPIPGPRVRVQGDLVFELHCPGPGSGVLGAAAEVGAAVEVAELYGPEVAASIVRARTSFWCA